MVVVQGSFQTPQVYEKFEKSLIALGYPVVHPILPSCHMPHDADFPKRTLVDDAYSVRQELSRLIERQGKTVCVVLHGYGGVVGSEAILQQFNVAIRQSQGLLGGVVHLFYVSACILAQDQSMLSTFEESLNNDVSVCTRFFVQFALVIRAQNLPAKRTSYHPRRTGYPVQRPPSLRGVNVGLATHTAITESSRW